jgi:hypothetical protein
MDNFPARCPGCGKKLQLVTQGPNSMLNKDQFDSVKAGDFYCETCPLRPGKVIANSGYAYYWSNELRDLPGVIKSGTTTSGDPVFAKSVN